MRISIPATRDRLVIAALVAFAGAEIAMFSLAGVINMDEGFYLLAGQRVYDGDVLYRDFPYFQAPLAPYVYGIPQALFGSSLYVGRATALVFTLGTFALTAYAGARIAGRGTAIAAIAMLLLTPLFMLHVLQARSEALVTPFVVLSALLALFLAPGWRLLLLPALAMLVASLVRANLLPVAALVFAFCAWRTGGDRWLLAAAAILAITVAAWSPFLVADADATVFNVVTAQNERRIQFSAAGEATPGGSVRDRYIGRVNEVAFSWTSYFHLLVPALAVVAIGYLEFQRGRRPTREHVDEPLVAALAMVALALAVWLPDTALDRQEPRYIAPSVPLLALAAALLVQSLYSIEGALHGRVLTVIATACVLPLSIALGLAWIDLDEPDIVETSRFASLIDERAPGPGNVITLDPTITVAADTSTPSELTMGLFSYWPFLSEADLERYHLVSRRRLEEMMLAPDTKAVVVSSIFLFIATGSSVPSELDRDATADPFRTFPRLRPEFEIVETDRLTFGQSNDRYWLLVRR